MMEILEFIFRDFWTFIGTLFLTAVISNIRLINVNVKVDKSSPGSEFLQNIIKAGKDSKKSEKSSL